MIINTNLSAQSAATSLMASSSALAKSLQRLSSGSKITSPADDSAGLAVSMKLSAEMNRVTAASNNLENAISFKQTQDGYLQKVGEALTRMSELTMLTLDATKTDADRAAYNTEYQALGQMAFNFGDSTFNGVSLFDGSVMATTVDAGGNTFALAGVDMNRSGSNATYFYAFNNAIYSVATATTTFGDLKGAIKQLATDRAQIGADLESLGYYHEQLTTLKTNLSAANSRIVDVDVAQESTQYARQNILVQTGTAMLAQANSLPQGVLKLLQ